MSPDARLAGQTPQDLHDLLRILDVASTLRRERERAAAELDLEAVKDRLRARLRAAADESGDPVTDAELDAAIDWYYARRHAFRPPPPGLRTLLALLWVRRRQAGVVLLVLLALALLGGLALLAVALPSRRRPIGLRPQRRSPSR